MFCPTSRRMAPWVWGLLFLALGVGLSFSAPRERVLGEGIRAVYLHGAWIWTAILSFLLASLLGMVGWLRDDALLQRQGRAWGWVATGFWLTALPISLWTMQVNWNGLFLLEPRWRLALAFGVTALILQIALLLLPLRWTAIVNTGFTTVYLFFLWRTPQILHPPSPIFQATSLRFPIHFLLVLLTLMMAAWSWTRSLVPQSPSG